jgi:hypothetical protein
MLITCLVVSSLSVFTAPSATAQAGYKPSVPQFTVKLIDTSYDIPPSSTTTIDPYTGKETTTTTPGYHVDQKSIEVTIKNQPFKPYTDADGYEHILCYAIHVKGHFSDVWTRFNDQSLIIQTNSSYTTVLRVVPYAAGFQVDFKVEIRIGYTRYRDIPEFVVEATSWSDIQTFTIPEKPSLSSLSPSQTTTFPLVTSDGNGQPPPPGQTQPLDMFTNPFFLLCVGALFVGVVVVVVMVFLRRRLKLLTYPDDFSPQADTSDMRCLYA